MIEIRGDSVFISGYVNAVERESDFIPSPQGRFKEIIRAKVFERALQRAKDVLLLFNHDENKKLGSITQGNLKLMEEDSIGLKAETEIRDSSIIEKAKQGNFLQGWSFGFIERKSRFEKGSDGIERRFIEDLDLIEVSLLSVKPAYPCCSVEIRNDGIHERRYSDLNLEIKNHEIKNPELDFSRYENEIKYLKLKGMF
ncbi:HK97 family phage prohead protease [Bacillus sp. DJP31]|uniref:HK97 family phage prohead protease n=1 Tax=Bacillus sp. DJP31 TaxID=3409789 RepID=UPI003BB6EA34